MRNEEGKTTKKEIKSIKKGQNSTSILIFSLDLTILVKIR